MRQHSLLMALRELEANAPGHSLDHLLVAVLLADADVEASKQHLESGGGSGLHMCSKRYICKCYFSAYRIMLPFQGKDS